VIITCEQCSTRFQLDDSRVPAEGVRVRCSRCKHSFFAKRAPSAGDPVENAVAHALREDDENPGGAPPEVDAAGAAPPRAVFEERPGAAGSEESDWEFNREPDPARQEPLAEPGIEAAREAVDALLTPSSMASADGIDDLFDTDGYVDDDIDALLGSGTDSAPGASVLDAAPELGQGPELAETPEPADAHEIADAPELATAPESSAAAPVAQEPVGVEASADESRLSSPDDWDFLADEVDAAVEPSETRRVVIGQMPASPPMSAAQLRPPVEVDLEPTRAGLWLGRAAHSLGWVGALLMAGWILQSSLRPAAPAPGADSATQSVAGLEALQVRGRWLDNAVAGPIFVVSGRLHSAGPGAVVPQARIVVRLYDASGVPLAHEVGSVGPALPEAWLREQDPAALQDRQAQEAVALARAPFWPDRSLSFQAVLGRLPEAAQRFDLVAVPLEEPAPAPPPGTAQALPQRS
jgi:predicted Zn finger-like uncharacterized protein